MAEKETTAVKTKDETKKEAIARHKAALEKLEGSAKKVTGHFGGFVDFVRKQGVVGLAVGLAIGTAAGLAVKDIVNGFINPIVQFITGSGSTLAAATWHVELWGRKADFAWGQALSSMITLIATALVIYWLVNIFKLDKLDKPKDA